MKPSLSPETCRGLTSARAYPADPSASAGVSEIQTHLSHVFLTGERVYKFRKAVDLGFVCFAAREERNADCAREVVLNRRLAPDVYLGVAPLEGEGAAARVGALAEEPKDPAREHCVVMRRLPEGRDALSLLERGELGPAQLDRLAARIAAFHAAHGLGAPAPFEPDAWLARCTGPVEDNFRLLAETDAALVPPDLLRRASEAAHAFVRAGRDRFERRRQHGRAVDGHGDLHLQHVFFERDEAQPIVIDCLEFSERLRKIDAASEVAFTAMDLAYRGHEDLAARFLRVYARERDDFDLYAVVDYFVAYRAAVRAKVAAIAARDPEIDEPQRRRAGESARRHLELAARALEPRAGAALVLVGGVVGSGKTTVAEALADAVGGVVVSSDRVRKHGLGLEPGRRAGGDAYTPEAKAAVYAALLERADPVLSSGRVAVLDATFEQRVERERARAFAQARDLPAFFVEARCTDDVARARLARREAEGRDASDAGPARLAASAAAFEPLDDWPAARRAAVDTGGAWRERVAELSRALRSPRGG